MRSVTVIFLIIVWSFSPLKATGQGGQTTLKVLDTNGQPLVGFMLCPVGRPALCQKSMSDGKLRVNPAAFKSGVVQLEIRSPAGWVFVSPWDGVIELGARDKPIVLARRGDLALLKDPNVLKAMVQRATTKAIAAREERLLEETAKYYGLPLAEMDKAIKAWAGKTKDPFDQALGDLYLERYREAEIGLVESARIRVEKENEAKLETAEASFFLGQALYKLGKFADAAEAYKLAAERRPNDARTLNEYGVALMAAGKYTDAAPVLWRAMTINEKARGTEHPDVATSLNNLAELYRTQGEYIKALPMYERALAIREKALGPEHLDVATSLNNLAELYRTQGEYIKALPMYEQALAIREKALGPEHPDVATSLNNLALLYLAQGEYKKVEPLFARSLAIRETKLGPTHPDTAMSLINMAVLYGAQGNYAQALPLAERAFAVFEMTLGGEHPITKTTAARLVEARKKLASNPKP